MVKVLSIVSTFPLSVIANMQAITERFGPSHMAFLVVPMVGAFFIDIVNALVIKLYLMLPIFAG